MSEAHVCSARNTIFNFFIYIKNISLPCLQNVVVVFCCLCSSFRTLKQFEFCLLIGEFRTFKFVCFFRQTNRKRYTRNQHKCQSTGIKMHLMFTNRIPFSQYCGKNDFYTAIGRFDRCWLSEHLTCLSTQNLTHDKRIVSMRM